MPYKLLSQEKQQSPGVPYTPEAKDSPPTLSVFVACVKKQGGILNNTTFF